MIITNGTSNYTLVLRVPKQPIPINIQNWLQFDAHTAIVCTDRQTDIPAGGGWLAALIGGLCGNFGDELGSGG